MAKINYQAALIKAAASGGGGIAAAALNKVSFINKQKPIIRGAAKILIGALAGAFVKNKKTKEFADAVGAGMAGVGAIELMNGVITSNGTKTDAETLKKVISIGAAGDYDPNIYGVGAVDAAYILDETPEYNEGISGDNML